MMATYGDKNDRTWVSGMGARGIVLAERRSSESPYNAPEREDAKKTYGEHLSVGRSCSPCLCAHEFVLPDREAL